MVLSIHNGRLSEQQREKGKSRLTHPVPRLGRRSRTERCWASFVLRFSRPLPRGVAAAPAGSVGVAVAPVRFGAFAPGAAAMPPRYPAA